MSSSADDSPGESGQPQDQDQLPLLQHALMRMWDVSRAAREQGEPIDLHHYERPPVETVRHALDRHAEEVYNALPSDQHRRMRWEDLPCVKPRLPHSGACDRPGKPLAAGFVDRGIVPGS